MSTWTDDQHATYANARLEWFLANQPTWVCAGCHDRVVEYAPDFSAIPCDHTAYCAGCVREHVLMPGDDGWARTGQKCSWYARVMSCRVHPYEHGCYLRGPGAQSYAAHVAAGTLR